MHGFGPVVVPGGDMPYHERWEPRVFALSTLVGIEGIGQGDGRPIREEMDPEEYLRASYYERWLWSTEQRLLRKGTISEADVEGWVGRLRAGQPAPKRVDPALVERALEAIANAAPLGAAAATRFAVDEAVRVKRMRPPGHTRCPRYVRRATGTIASVRGVDAFPDIGPYKGPLEPVYSVAFTSDELFGTPDPSTGETGSWKVMLDLSESYLEPA
jgi:hypothetical protein